MSDTLVKDFKTLKELMKHLSDIGLDVLPEQATDSMYETWCGSKGYYKIYLDDGVHYRWVRADNILDAVNQVTAGTTGAGLTVGGTSSTITTAETLTGDVVSATGELVAENVASYTISDTTISATGLSTTASGAVAGDTAAAVTLTPKTAVVAAVLAALGFEASFVLTQEIVNAMTGSDDPIEWNPFCAGDEILTYLTEDGKTYVPQELVEQLHQWLYNHGYLDDAVGHEGEWTNKNVNTMSLQQAAGKAASKMLETISQMDSYSQNIVNDKLSDLYDFINNPSNFSHVDGFDGLGSVSFRFGPTDTIGIALYYTLVRYGTNTVIEGVINSTGGSVQIGEANGWETSYPTGGLSYDHGIHTNGTTLTEGSHFANGDPNVSIYSPGHYPNVVVTVINTGQYSDQSLPRRPGAVLPTPNVPLSDTYPDWYKGRLFGDNEEDGKPHDKNEDKPGVLPLQLPTSDPSTWNQDDIQDGTNTQEDLDDKTQTQEDLVAGTDIPITPPTDPIGETPIIAVPTSGSGAGLVKIYNPTLASLASFSQWLWSSNVFDNFSKLFQDPMQAIIGLNLLYATPSRGADSNIIVGNLDSNVSSRTVSNQYININCGSVTVNRYFNNALDYIDTVVECYLPFIGIVRLNASDLIGKTVNIKATIDVLTGTVLYNIYVGSQLLYTYNGTCAVQLPLSSANYSGIFSTLAGIAGSAVSGFALGGPAGAIGGALGSGITGIAGGGLSHSVERSGSIGSNAGAMGVKKPYLIITRHKPYNPSAYNKYYGFPANSTVQQLSSISGFTKVKDIRVNGIVATQTELNEIEQLLKGGVIL